MRIAAWWLYAAASWLLVAGLFVQVFLAGLGVFDSPERFEIHRNVGYTLELLPLVMVLAGLVGRLGLRYVGLAALIFGLFIVQSILIALRGQTPAIAALHPVNGFVILLLAIVVARQAVRSARPSPATA